MPPLSKPPFCLPIPPLVLLLVLTLIPPLSAQLTECPPGKNLKKNPRTICTFRTEFRRQRDSSALVVDTISYTHTREGNFHRFIPFNPRFQDITNVTATRNGLSLDVEPEKFDRFGTFMQVRIAAVNSITEPVIFVLSYRITNAAMLFTKPCDLGRFNPENNIYAWSLGPYHREIHKLFVTFHRDPTDPSSEISEISEKDAGGFKQDRLELSFNNVQGDVDIFVEERNGRTAKIEFQCPPDLFPKWKIVIIVVMIAIPVGLVLCTIITLIIGTLFGYRDPKEDLLDYTEGETLTDKPHYTM